MLVATKQMGLMRKHATEAAATLRLVGNENRLVILCLLVQGEMGVGSIQERVDLSQSALSQHLAKLRVDGLISARRESQNIYYRLADDRIVALMSALADIFCPDEIKTVGSSR